jgi:viologen exporter family transport system permease protein
LAFHATDWPTSAYRAYWALAVAGFQRYATYRQAMVAAVVTNSVFGFLRFAVMLAVIEAGARAVAGYNEPQLATFVFAGQGLIGVVLLWALPELAERIRTGDVVTDLLRPIDPVWQQLAADLGRAGYAVLTRFVVPVVVGALVFELYAPRRSVTYALFVCSMLLATIVCFACRYLVNASAYWLLDVRGPQTAWVLTPIRNN